MRVIEQTIIAFEDHDSVVLNLSDLSKAFACLSFKLFFSKITFYEFTEHSVKIIQRSSYIRKLHHIYWYRLQFSTIITQN